MSPEEHGIGGTRAAMAIPCHRCGRSPRLSGPIQAPSHRHSHEERTGSAGAFFLWHARVWNRDSVGTISMGW